MSAAPPPGRLEKRSHPTRAATAWLPLADPYRPLWRCHSSECVRARGGGSGGECETFTIRLTHVVTPVTPKGQTAEKFWEVVEERSGG